MDFPRVDFSILGELPSVYRQQRMETNRERTLADIGRGASVNEVAAKLFQAGDIQGGLSLAQLGRSMANDEWNRTYQGGMLDVARQNANRQEVPTEVQKLRAAGIQPGTPAAAKALYPRTDTPISATDKKAIFEAEDTVPQLQGTLEALNRAKELNSQTFTGLTAGLRGMLGTKVPGGGALVDKGAALATEEWSKIMGPEALNQMANTLKGATTDFELRKFIEMLADPSTDPRVRAGVIDRMSKLAERKLEIQTRRVRDLRSQDYFKPETTRAAPSGSPAAPARPASRADYDSLPSGSQYIAPDGSVRTKR